MAKCDVCTCQGVKAVIAESFDESHRRALVGVGVLPLEFVSGQTACSLELTGREKFTINNDGHLDVRQEVTVLVSNIIVVIIPGRYL